MTRRTISPIVPFAFAVLLSTACDVFSSEPVLQAFVSVEPERFAVGDSSEITVTAVNRSGHRVLASAGCLWFQVRDSADNFVAPRWLCALALPSSPYIEPGGTRVWSITWRGETWGNPAWLPPGVYRVFGVLDVGEAQAVSLPVTVELLEARSHRMGGS